MLGEVAQALQVPADAVLVDATFGLGGHSRALLQHLGPDGRLLVCDADPAAMLRARRLALEDPRLMVLGGNFAHMEAMVAGLGLTGTVHGLVADLGLSSAQLADRSRGFSFRERGRLDMRFDPEQGETAAQWLQRATEGQIAQVLRDYGQEPACNRIARALVQARSKAPLETTSQLAEVVAHALGGGYGRHHPATRTFQALRMQVNSELRVLAELLDSLPAILKPGGRACMISFHSLEDRLVKQTVRARRDVLGELGKPLRPTAQECAANPRARSAIMRVVERLSS